MKKIILGLLSVFVLSLLLLGCAPKQAEVMEEQTAEGTEMPEQSAGTTTVSDVEVEADLEKLSLEELNKVIAVGEADKGKPLTQQAYNNPDWLTIAYKVKAEKLAEESESTSGSVNHAPVFKDFSNKNGAENEELEFTVAATDEDGDALAYDVKDEPPGATLSKTGKFSWTPGFDKAGSYEMTFIVSDGKTTATKTITVTIANTNRPPKFDAEIEGLTKIDATVNEKFQLFLAATDPDGDVLKYLVKETSIDASVVEDTGVAEGASSAVAPFGYPVTFAVTDGIDTVEKKITVLVFPKTCAKNTECPAGYLCQEPTSSCVLRDLTNLRYICESGMNTTAKQDSCVSEGISYWTDDTKGHNLCYKVDPSLTLNSCTVTKQMSGKYKYDCSFTATCDYSSLN